MYFAALSPRTGELVSLNMTPMQIRRLRLNRPSQADCKWLGDTLDRMSAPYGAHVELMPDGTLKLRRA
jgi:poly-gamma-glutamate synthesis protein (capsule biosynthesis protein)